MSPLVLGALLLAAALHATYHLLLKSARETHLFTWWALTAGAVLFSPLLLTGGGWPARVWPLLALSALAEAAYFLVLASAYRRADFSIAYPLARGTAPALIALWAVLWLGERPRPAGVLGIAVLVAGLWVVGASGRAGRPRGGGAGILAALIAAVLISVYSTLDGAAVRLASPAPYTAAVLGLTALLMTPAMLWRYPPAAILDELRTGWRRILLVGPLMLISYALVLYAFAAGSVSYAGAVREVSIIFAALAGWRWLGEGMGGRRLAGAALICLGILVIAVAG